MPLWRLRIAAMVLLTLLFSPIRSAAYDDERTHPLLTDAALQGSSVDATLKNELVIVDGLATTLQGKSPIDWAREGSTHEDSVSFCNASNRFHNPLKLFRDARMSDADIVVVPTCGTAPRSSVVWGTRFITPTVKGPAVGNPFDWDVTRIQYLQALTLGSAAEREASLAGTVFSLGHVIH